MILVFTERADLNSRIVLSYLNNYEEPFEVFLEDDAIELEYLININRNQFDYRIYKNHRFVCDSSDLKSVWYRRTDIQVYRFGTGEFSQEGLKTYSREHMNTRYEQIQRCFHAKRCLGKFGFGNYNKIEFLEQCISLNIEIPGTLITGSKQHLLEFWKNCRGGIITKSLAFPFECVNYSQSGEADSYRMGYTISVGEAELESLPDFFDLSLFQEKLDKLFEIRAIYLNGSVYSEAIFSQSREVAALDYRLGYDSGMRMCNYTLPDTIEEQVQRLMEKLDLNFGSLDIVVTTDKRYVFLEVNPNGQYGAVSQTTNSNVDYQVAKFLMNK
ncbi:hypothetical protein [Fluviicola chungangensis]|uniref:Grasp-with-spasm system ATP-grasp peptide maturase n=1 Tax=Fluviicola chungangensis TaxID=2597671 RepID=A0A556N3T7_9FLAO|nr:hypothetical protein [Fluviicola chungangensis]TSJ46718.1 hypothetical protein FO442_06035 [Fluviicola chungangensis]